MGDSISAAHDDYEDYEDLCKRANVKARGFYDKFYDHMREVEIALQIDVKNTNDHILGEN